MMRTLIALVLTTLLFSGGVVCAEYATLDDIENLRAEIELAPRTSADDINRSITDLGIPQSLKKIVELFEETISEAKKGVKHVEPMGELSTKIELTQQTSIRHENDLNLVKSELKLLSREQTILEKEQALLKRESEYNKEFRNQQTETNKSYTEGLKICLDKVKEHDLKIKDHVRNWDRMYGIIAAIVIGSVIACVKWYLKRKQTKALEALAKSEIRKENNSCLNNC